MSFIARPPHHHPSFTSTLSISSHAYDNNKLASLVAMNAMIIYKQKLNRVKKEIAGHIECFFEWKRNICDYCYYYRTHSQSHAHIHCVTISWRHFSATTTTITSTTFIYQFKSNIHYDGNFVCGILFTLLLVEVVNIASTQHSSNLSKRPFHYDVVTSLERKVHMLSMPSECKYVLVERSVQNTRLVHHAPLISTMESQMKSNRVE